MTDRITREPPRFPLEPPNLQRRLSLLALDEAIADLGRGEIGANNAGPYVWGLTGRRTSGAWCAAAVWSWHWRAAQREGLVWPIPREHGARRLAALLAAQGVMVPPTEMPMPGDVALWSRGVTGWQGHVGLVRVAPGRGRFVTVEGNVGGFPAVVREFDHRLGEKRLLGFARWWAG